jgi:hypothetical protein
MKIVPAHRASFLRSEFIAVLAIMPLLAACGADKSKVRSAPAPAPVATPRQHSRLPPVRPPVHQAPSPAQVLVAPGLEGVIGASQAELTRQFGTPRLEVWEGDARKLQFSGAACVLDIYLYPSAPGREPQATYVDARRASDGKDVDRASCIGALRRGGSPPVQAPIPGG